MRVKELIEMLQECDPEGEINFAVLDHNCVVITVDDQILITSSKD